MRESSAVLRPLGTMLWLVIAFGLFGCAGDSAGDGLGIGNTQDDRACVESRTPVDSPSQLVSELGFSASEVLAFSEAEHESTLRWLPVELVAYGPESGDVALSISVRYAGGPIDFVESEAPPPGDFILDRPASSDSCVDVLAIEVEVELATAEGALAERFTAELRASSVLSADILHSVELDSLDGSFNVMLREDSEDASRGTTELSQSKLRLTFSELGTQGRFEAQFLQRSGNGGPGYATGGFLEFARWPGGSRCGDAIEAPLDASAGGWSPSEVLAEINALSPASFRWTGGDPTELALDVQPARDFACLHLRGGGVSLQARAMAETADGGFNADLPLRVTWSVAEPVHPTSATPMQVRLNSESSVTQVAPSQVDAMFPGMAVDLSAYEQLLLSFGGLYKLAEDATSGEAARGSGVVTLIGSNPISPCTQEELEALEAGRPTRNCGGRDDTTLSNGRWNAR